MAIILGTTGTDTLVGTTDADVLTPMGTTVGGDREVLRGLDGGDEYNLQRNGTAGIYNFLINDRGTDGGIDAITNVGALYQSASLGYSGYATARRVGDDLIIHTPHKPHRFRDPSKPAYDIRIKDQYGDGHIETMEAGGVTYTLTVGSLGTALPDVMAGTNVADGFMAGAGNDWMFGNGGRDTLDAGDGDDVIFGGNGGDSITAGGGNDLVFGEKGNDRIFSGSGADRIDGGDGSDRIWAGADGDRISGGDGNDVIRGEAGQDHITGDLGNDLLIGGTEGDIYSFRSRAEDAGWGHDTVRDIGNAPSYLNADKLELSGFFGPADGTTVEAYARLSFARLGDDMLITADGGTSTILVDNMFHANANRWAIENLELKAGYWNSIVFQILNGDSDAIGDDRDYANAGYGGAANELIFGTDANNEIFGDSGTNFIWTGDGADTLIYKENDNESWFGFGGGLSQDIVEDFDVLLDIMDFSEIESITSMADLTLGTDADGDVTIYWNSGDYEISSIFIELRGVTMAEIAVDMFVFV